MKNIIKYKADDHLGSTCFFTNSVFSDLIVITNGKRRKGKPLVWQMTLSMKCLFPTRSVAVEKFYDMHSVPLFKVFRPILSGLTFHFHMSHSKVLVTSWSFIPLGALEVTFVFFGC